MFQHLLIPLDGSESGELALTYACSLAQKYNSQMTLLHILPTGEVDHLPASEHTSTQLAVNYLRQQEGRLREEGFRVTAVFRQGEPVHTLILDAVVTENADTVIMSAHRATSLKRLMYSNTAEKVTSKTAVPILLIRP